MSDGVYTGAQECVEAGIGFHKSVLLFQRDYLLIALTASGGKVPETASAVNIDVKTLGHYLRGFGIVACEIRKALRPPEIREKHAKRAERTRKDKRRAKGLDANAPKRPLKQPRIQKPINVARPTAPLPPPVLRPRERVTLDELGWADEQPRGTSVYAGEREA